VIDPQEQEIQAVATPGNTSRGNNGSRSVIDQNALLETSSSPSSGELEQVTHPGTRSEFTTWLIGVNRIEVLFGPKVT
jgi:hypothetical protein